MFSLRDVILFLAGIEFFHTISHIFIIYFLKLPLDMKFMVLTPTINWITIIANAIITVLLLWLAYRMKKT